MSGTARAVGRDLVLQIVLRVVSLALGVLALAVLARALGREGMGEWTALATLVAIILEFSEMGLEGLAVRRAAARPERERELIGTLVALRALLVVPTMLVAGGIGVLLATSGDMRAAALVVAATAIPGVPGSLRAVFQLRLRNDVPQLIVVVNSVLWTGAVLLLAWQGVGALTAFAFALLGTQLVTATIQAVVALRIVRPDLSRVRRLGPEMLRVGVVLGLGSLVIGAYARVDQLLVLRLAGPDAAGVFGTAIGTMDRLGVVPLTITMTLTPLLAAAAVRGRAAVRRQVLLFARLMLVAALGLVALFGGASEPIVAALYGEEFAPVAGVLPFVAANFALSCLGYVTTTLVLVHERQRRQLVVALLGLLVNVPLNLLIIPAYGYLGAIAVATATELFVLALITWTVRSSLPRAGVLWPPVARTAIAAGLTYAATITATRAGLPLVVVLAVAGVAYAGALALARAMTLDELRLLRAGGPPAPGTTLADAEAPVAPHGDGR